MAGRVQHEPVGGSRSGRTASGLARFEVAALPRDKDLIRSLARRLAEAGPGDDDVRAEVRRILDAPGTSERGRIWRALRASPLVGADLDLTRDEVRERDVDL